MREPVRRHAIAIRANQFVARYLMLPACDAVLAPERRIPVAFDDASVALERGGWGPALDELGAACGCDPIDLDILGVLVAPDIDPELRAVYRNAIGKVVDLDRVRALVDP